MTMGDDTASFWVEQIKERELDRGGFASKLGRPYSREATCWAILALSNSPSCRDMVRRARARLAADQFPDGSICVSREHPKTFWPTSLAILAWQQSAEHRKSQAKAVQFLLETIGEHSPKDPDSPLAHDTDLKGWPWIGGTRSWVEPTGLAMMALRIAGYGDHERLREGARLLLDRQLPHGGWNYGNTLVFGQELRPMPLNTGIALNAVRNETPLENIQGSLTYLKNRVTSLRTPRSLGWSLLGLGAWQNRPAQAQRLIHECFDNQERYGTYDTSSVALLILASKATGGLEEALSHAEHAVKTANDRNLTG
jgi:hypothetical protein